MNEPLPVTPGDVEEAAQRLLGVAHRTPVLTSRHVDQQLDAKVFFKCENFQRAGAFKIRGAYNALSKLGAERAQGVVTFSSGNHAQAIALAASIWGVRATIVMPDDAPFTKLAATRGYGAEVILYKRGEGDRDLIASQYIREHGGTLIPPFDHRDVIAGQGTVAAELIDEVGTLDFLFVPIGGGGLISGCSIASAQRAPNCKIIGVEPATGNDAQQTLRTGKLVKIPVPKTIADGAQTQCIGQIVLPIVQAHVDDILTVTDEQLQYQMRFFAERMKIIVEPTGCLAAAAATSRQMDLKGSRVGVVVTGGNVDLSQFCRYLAG